MSLSESMKRMVVRSIGPIIVNRSYVEHTYNEHVLFGSNTNDITKDHLFYCGFNDLTAKEQLRILNQNLNISIGSIIFFPMLYQTEHDWFLQPYCDLDGLRLRNKFSICRTNLFKLCLERGCELLRPVLYGNWSGIQQANQPGLDIVAIRKVLSD